MRCIHVIYLAVYPDKRVIRWRKHRFRGATAQIRGTVFDGVGGGRRGIRRGSWRAVRRAAVVKEGRRCKL